MSMTTKRISQKPCPSNHQPVLRSASKRRGTVVTSPKAKRRKNGESAKEHSKNGNKAGTSRAASPSRPSKASSRPPIQSGSFAQELREKIVRWAELEKYIQEPRAKSAVLGGITQKLETTREPRIPAGKVQAYADTNGLPPGMPDNLTRETAQDSQAPEIETSEWLAAQGWERLTLVFESEMKAGEECREREILSDLAGQLWLVTAWHSESGRTLRAERRRISRGAACAHMARFRIPDAFHGDFRECQPPKLRLETAIQETRAFLLLMADAEGGQRYGNFTGDKGEAIQAGIMSLSHSLGDELAAAFYTMEDAE